MSRVLLLSDFDLDMLMACRYAYYCCERSIVPDVDYDTMEKDYRLVNGDLPVGSSRKEDYTEAQRALALYFMFSGRSLAPKRPRRSAPAAPLGEELL
jgi:hypothetical protein